MTDTLSYDEWEVTYKPIKNLYVQDAGFNGCLYETYGTEEQVIKHLAVTDPQRVWTWVDGDDGTYLISGMAFVNRIGYIITEHPCPEQEHVEVEVDKYEEYEESV